jgi:hypothetical protein
VIVVSTETAPPVSRGLPRWAIVLLAVAGAIVVTVVGLIVALIAAVIAAPDFGPTDAAALQPGSCLAESAQDLPTYTVIDCESAHPLEVVARIDLGRGAGLYTTPSALASYAGEICNRFLEYGLFVTADVDESFVAVPLAVPTPELAASGTTGALCAVAKADGSALTGSVYRPMP